MITKYFHSLIFSVFVFMGISIIHVGCTELSEYEKMVNKGLNSGIENKDLFLGYHFGMTRKEFHFHSMEMNKKQLITGGASIVYKLEDLKSTATFEFYPLFKDEKIVRMPVNIKYDSWAPWNEQFSPEELLNDMREYYSEVYNTTFKNVFIPELEKEALVSIEGNREIRMYIFSPNAILVDFLDLNETFEN